MQDCAGRAIDSDAEHFPGPKQHNQQAVRQGCAMRARQVDILDLADPSVGCFSEAEKYI